MKVEAATLTVNVEVWVLLEHNINIFRGKTGHNRYGSTHWVVLVVDVEVDVIVSVETVTIFVASAGTTVRVEVIVSVRVTKRVGTGAVEVEVAAVKVVRRVVMMVVLAVQETATGYSLPVVPA